MNLLHIPTNCETHTSHTEYPVIPQIHLGVCLRCMGFLPDTGCGGVDKSNKVSAFLPLLGEDRQ